MQLNLKQKLIFAFGLQIVFIVGIGITGYLSLQKVSAQYKHINLINTPKVQTLANLRFAQRDVVFTVGNAIASDRSDGEIDEKLKGMQEAADRFENLGRQLETLQLEPTEQSIWKTVKENWNPFVSLSKKIIENSRQNSSVRGSDFNTWYKKDLPAARASLREPLERLRELITKDAESWSFSAENVANQAQKIMGASALAGGVLGALFAFYLITHLTAILSKITTHLSCDAKEVDETSQKIAHSSRELAASVTKQASAIEQTSAAIEEITSMLNKTSESAQRSSVVSEESKTTIQQGQDVVQQMLRAMEAINQSNAQINSEIENGNQQIREIVKVISEIDAKTKVINDIVFQTKLLSFNASVEAARAGEHGKGFAVVAEEVGNLAAMSGNAAEEISQMLELSIEKVESIIDASTLQAEKLARLGQEKVSVGLHLAGQCDQSFQEIISKTTEVTNLMSEISSATQEQSAGIVQVSKAITQLSEAIQQGGSVSENSALFATHMSEQSKDLCKIVTDLEQIIYGSKTPAPHDHVSNDKNRDEILEGQA